MQETMITSPSLLAISWRGNYVFTPGTGHGRGCITLMGTNLAPTNIKHLQDRGHILTLQQKTNKLIVANIYAPTTLSEDKIIFFIQLKEAINELREPEDDVIIAGDLNTIFEEYECKNRSFSLRERAQSNRIKQILNDITPHDSWQGNRTTHTWRKNKQSSRLDRIMYEAIGWKLNKCETDWTFTNSDHAAVIAILEHTEPKPNKTCGTPKLDPYKLSNGDFKEAFINEYSRLIREEPMGWDPHLALEFHKCAIRSAYAITSEQFNTRHKQTINELKSELETLIEAIERPGITAGTENRLIDKINVTRSKIYKHNNHTGQMLANKLKTRWYNEGERSNKYFLNILKRRKAQGVISEMLIDDQRSEDPTAIENHITNFYKKLYNQQREDPTEEKIESVLRNMPEFTAEMRQLALKPITVKDL